MVVKSTPKVRAINFPASLAGCCHRRGNNAELGIITPPLTRTTTGAALPH
jgi:hypothetical protein